MSYKPFNLYGLYKSYAQPYVQDYAERALGYRAYKNAQASAQNTIGYEEYIKKGNERALQDWHRNVGIPQGRTIAYPEFSYSGQIYRSNTSIANAYLGVDTAYSGFVGNLSRRAWGAWNSGSGLYTVPNHSYSRYM